MIVRTTPKTCVSILKKHDFEELVSVSVSKCDELSGVVCLKHPRENSLIRVTSRASSTVCKSHCFHCLYIQTDTGSVLEGHRDLFELNLGGWSQLSRVCKHEDHCASA